MPDPFAHLRNNLTPQRVGFICMIAPRRIGVRAFIQHLEYRHFPPLPYNDDFQLYGPFLWEDMVLAIVVIPKSKKHLADSILAEIGLCLKDGVPHVLESGGGKPIRESHFPIDVPNLSTVINIPGHFIYENDPLLYGKALQAEDEALERGLQEMMARWKAIEEKQKSSKAR